MPFQGFLPHPPPPYTLEEYTQNMLVQVLLARPAHLEEMVSADLLLDLFFILKWMYLRGWVMGEGLEQWKQGSLLPNFFENIAIILQLFS